MGCHPPTFSFVFCLLLESMLTLSQESSLEQVTMFPYYALLSPPRSPDPSKQQSVSLQSLKGEVIRKPGTGTSHITR